MTGSKRIGRPVKPAKRGTKVSLGLKVTADVKGMIDSAAKKSGRTQSQEAELRLERSFQSEDVFTAALGGPAMRNIALLMIATFAHAGETKSAGRTPKEWLRDPDVYRWAFVSTAMALIDGMPNPSSGEAKRALDNLIRHAATKYDITDGVKSGFVAAKKGPES